jgi:hypothetical protein
MFKFFRWHPRVAFLFTTLGIAAKDLVYFIIVFFVFFIAFAHVRPPACGHHHDPAVAPLYGRA